MNQMLAAEMQGEDPGPGWQRWRTRGGTCPLGMLRASRDLSEATKGSWQPPWDSDWAPHRWEVSQRGYAWFGLSPWLTQNTETHPPWTLILSSEVSDSGFHLRINTLVFQVFHLVFFCFHRPSLPQSKAPPFPYKSPSSHPYIQTCSQFLGAWRKDERGLGYYSHTQSSSVG